MKPSDDLIAKWLWATIASGLDCGITPERMEQVLSKRNIRFVVDTWKKQKEATHD
jgi:hypothetical protein